MITQKLPRETIDLFVDGGDYEREDLATIAENFFEYGYGKKSNRRFKDNLEYLLSELEDRARYGGSDVCGAVMGKCVLLTFTRIQVVEDALSYLSRAAEKGIDGAVQELCTWYAARIKAGDLGNFPNADVGLDDCYDPTPEHPRVTFPTSTSECRRRLVYWLSKVPEKHFAEVRLSFSALTGSVMGVPSSWREAMDELSKHLSGGDADMLEHAKALIEGGQRDGTSRQISEGVRILRELAENYDNLEAWKYMLECHERGVGPLKTNKFRRAAKAAISRLENS